MSSREFRDPAQIVAEQEIRDKRKEPCFGCDYWSRIFGISWCQAQDQPANKRCEKYKE